MQCTGCMRLRLLKDIAARKIWTFRQLSQSHLVLFARIFKMIQTQTQTSLQHEGKFWRKIRSFFSSSSLPQPLSKLIKRFLTIYGDGDGDSGIQVHNVFDPPSTSVMVQAFGDSKLIPCLFCIFWIHRLFFPFRSPPSTSSSWSYRSPSTNVPSQPFPQPYLNQHFILSRQS